VDKKKQFIQTIQSNSGIIRKAASLYTNNQQDKEDLTQEIIYQLWKSFDSFQNHSAISTWIYRVAMNVAIYYFKKSKKSILTIPIEIAVLKTPNSSLNENQEKWEKIHAQIQHLTLLERGIIMLYLEEKSYREIAVITGLSESNIGTKMQRIKEKIKRRITNQNSL